MVEDGVGETGWAIFGGTGGVWMLVAELILKEMDSVTLR
jgi:hypothetical protein